MPNKQNLYRLYKEAQAEYERLRCQYSTKVCKSYMNKVAQDAYNYYKSYLNAVIDGEK